MCATSFGMDAAARANEVGPMGTISVPFPLTEQPGDKIGRYKLLQEIGEGSFGVVYMAQQEEPVKRRVALKIIKLGMDTKEVIARFEAERQALALMDHPNIAKVFDAGAASSGRPYFVMELVKGERITDYCDKNSLSTRERLDLFIKVCNAIQHAHQKGIIHRDIKPSNTLVTLHDGVPVPKVIDFGIAKATQGRLTDRTVFTAFEQFIGTPAYMSPEQAEMSGLDIDTRSDIYSLGVLLYELLAGRTPFDPRDLMVSGIDAMRKTIRELDPVRPSTRVATLKEGDLTTTAKRRSTDNAKLMHQLQGDLDWIVMKCLEKDRTRRYETVNGLAMDIRRHLDNQPVLARPPTTAYRLQKALRRHKVVVAAGAAIAAALVLGVIGTTLGLLRAEDQRRTAEKAMQDECIQEEKALNAMNAEKEQRMRAETEELAARRAAYSSAMNLAQQALAANNLGRARRLLDQQRPQHGQQDLRDWEWRYLWDQTRADDHEVFYAGTNRILHPLSFSAEGWLLAREEGGVTVVADLISRREVLQRTNAWWPVFTHHGTRLAVVEMSPTNETIALLDMATQKEKRFETSWKITRWMGFTDDDRLLLTVSVRPGALTTDALPYEVTAWNVDTGSQLWQRAMEAPSTWNGRPYAISPDGSAFAAVLPEGCVQVLEIKDGRERFTIKATKESSIAAMFSPDSAILLTGAGYTDSAIRLWDAHSGKTLGSLEGHRSWVSDLLFTADGKSLISSSGDQTIRLWDWSTRKPAGVLHGHLDEVDGLALARDGRTLASRCKDGSIFLWNLTRPPRNFGYLTLPGRLDESSPLFTPDSRSILAAEINGGVDQWDAFTLKETHRVRVDSTNRTHTLISHDLKWFLQYDAEGRLVVWDAHNGLESTNFMAAAGPLHACLTDNGKYLVTLSGPNTNSVLEVRETGTWQRKDSLNTHAGWLITTSLSNSFALVTTRALLLFDVTKLDQPPKEIESQGVILDATTSPDGRTIAAAYEDGSVRLWDVATLQPLDAFKGFLLSANSVCYSPDGRRLAVGSAGSEAVKLWDAETRQEVLTLSGEGSSFGCLTFSPDGRFLLAINEAGLAHLWSAPSWAEIAAAEADEKKEAQR
jgi:WD40 repeat protein/tRNA A-37 threonylcarbamoyl transferase component Bud32